MVSLGTCRKNGKEAWPEKVSDQNNPSHFEMICSTSTNVEFGRLVVELGGVWRLHFFLQPPPFLLLYHQHNYLVVPPLFLVAQTFYQFYSGQQLYTRGHVVAYSTHHHLLCPSMQSNIEASDVMLLWSSDVQQNHYTVLRTFMSQRKGQKDPIHTLLPHIYQMKITTR